MTIDVATEADRAITALVSGGVEDPFPLYDTIRELGSGVHWSNALNAWVVGRYDDVHAMFSDPVTFSNDYFYEMPTGIHDPDNPEHKRYIAINSQQFMVMDPPEHTRIRSIFRGAFTPRAVSRWQNDVEDITDQLLDEFHPGDEIDLMPKLATTVPVAVIARILGVPDADTPKFRDWTEAYVKTFDPVVQGREREQCISTTLTLFDYLHTLVDSKRSQPADDLITTIATTPTSDGDVLEIASTVAQVALLLAAGNDTTTSLIGNTVTLLLQNPRTHERLRQQPDLVPAAIEESLRCDPPFHLDARKATRDVEVGGHRIRAGDLCLQLFAAANRDPRQFDRADHFDIDRAPRANRHLAFGHGIHFCVGAPLARMEGAVIVRKLLERFPDLAEGSTPARRRVDTITVRGWQTRPVRL
jgi:cytochrome P450